MVKHAGSCMNMSTWDADWLTVHGYTTHPVSCVQNAYAAELSRVDRDRTPTSVAGKMAAQLAARMVSVMRCGLNGLFANLIWARNSTLYGPERLGRRKSCKLMMMYWLI